MITRNYIEALYKEIKKESPGYDSICTFTGTFFSKKYCEINCDYCVFKKPLSCSLLDRKQQISACLEEPYKEDQLKELLKLFPSLLLEESKND